LGCDTLSGIGDRMPIDAKATCKDVKKGRDRGAVSYGVQEHVSLLCIVYPYHSSFNASPQSGELFTQKCAIHFICTGYNLLGPLLHYTLTL
jgi:hypothetical protein